MVITASLKFISNQNQISKMSDIFFIWTPILFIYAFSLIEVQGTFTV